MRVERHHGMTWKMPLPSCETWVQLRFEKRSYSSCVSSVPGALTTGSSGLFGIGVDRNLELRELVGVIERQRAARRELRDEAKELVAARAGVVDRVRRSAHRGRGRSSGCSR